MEAMEAMLATQTEKKETLRLDESKIARSDAKIDENEVKTTLGARAFLLIKPDGVVATITTHRSPTEYLRGRVDKNVLCDVRDDSTVYLSCEKNGTEYIVHGLDITPYGVPNAYFTYFASSSHYHGDRRLMRGEFLVEKLVYGAPVDIDDDEDFDRLFRLMKERCCKQSVRQFNMEMFYDHARTIAIAAAIFVGAAVVGYFLR